MNERIQKLAEQAGFKFIDIRDQFHYNEDSPIKKFAELIVRECALVAGMPSMTANTKIETNMSYIRGFTAGREEAELEILSHFKISE